MTERGEEDGFNSRVKVVMTEFMEVIKGIGGGIQHIGEIAEILRLIKISLLILHANSNIWTFLWLQKMIQVELRKYKYEV